MDITSNKKHINLPLAFAAVLIVGAGIILYFHHSHTSVSPQNLGNIHSLPSQLPPAMPAGIVLATDAKVISSYTGDAQSTLVYTTAEPPSVLNKDYFDFLVKHQWMIIPSKTDYRTSASTTVFTINTLDTGGLVVRQGGETMSINMVQGNQGLWSVSITVVPTKH